MKKLRLPKVISIGGELMLDVVLERVVLRILQLGIDRCGAGFGKYPLGIRDAVEELLPLVKDSELVTERLAAFDKKLDEY